MGRDAAPWGCPSFSVPSDVQVAFLRALAATVSKPKTPRQSLAQHTGSGKTEAPSPCPCPTP